MLVDTGENLPLREMGKSLSEREAFAFVAMFSLRVSVTHEGKALSKRSLIDSKVVGD